MGKRRGRRGADLTINTVLADFLEEQKKRLAARTVNKYRSIIQLLGHCLDGYGPNYLDETELERYRTLTKGADERTFCDIFGPDKILDIYDEFLDYFMVRKVYAGKDLMRSAGTVTKKLAKWLAAKGYVNAEAAQAGYEDGAKAAKDLPQAATLRDMLDAFAAHNFPSGEQFEGHFQISAVRPDSIEVESVLEVEALGTVALPKEIAALCKEGWTISGVLSKLGSGRYAFVEIWNVYP